MALQQRLLLILGTSFTLLWLAVAAWLLRDLDQELQRTLDQRLAASARMVSGLITQFPEETWQKELKTQSPFTKELDVVCQVRSEDENLLLQTHRELPPWLGTQEEGFSEHEIHGEKWRVYTTKTNGLYISTADKVADRKLLNKSIFLASSVPFLVALFGSLIALWLGVRRGLSPLGELRHALSQRRPDSLAPVNIKKAPEELKPVIENLNLLLARMEDTLAREQRFTSDAAHELRTPLTAIKTHLQLANRSEGNAQHQFLSDAEAAVVRLQRILEQLLTLARVESSYQWGQEEASPVSDLVELAMADLAQKDRINTAGLDPKLQALHVAIPSGLAGLALKNLLDNALRHSDATSPVYLSTQCHQHNTMVEFIVENQGDELTPETIAHFTQRFWRNSQANGSGLGLAIVEAIAHRFGGQLAFSLNENGQLMAKLQLPLSSC